MNLKTNITIGILTIILSGCSSEPEPDHELKPDSESAKNKKQVETVIADPAIKTLNKAKNLEQQMKDAEAARKKKMEEQEDTEETP